ncbi:hypothetical protein CBL_09198 [Carabus blaptoides fortunei]
MALHRLWNLGRRVPAPSNSVFDEPATIDDIFIPDQEIRENGIKRTPSNCQLACPSTYAYSDAESDYEYCEPELQEQIQTTVVETPKVRESVTLDASLIGDIPARYTIPALEPHQFPVVGVYADPRVVPGFKYHVKPLQAPDQLPTTLPGLFGERALTLKSIGRGYARRFTFEADPNCLLSNENYFWSDNRPEGFVFEIEVVSVGDKFTVFDANHVAQGTLEVVNIEGPQYETNSIQVKDGIEKTIKINFTGKVEYYETGVAKPLLISGSVTILKRRGNSNAELTKITNVSIGSNRRGFILKPGIQRNARRVTVRGKDIGDIPTKYTMTGMEPYEIPVVGTYVDPRIVPGFSYRVRPNDRKEHLFAGRALKLQSIGMGYAKRLTFTPDSLVEPNNYFWSDTHPDGVGLEPRAVHTGMKFAIIADGHQLGKACVFRADMPQREERQETIELANGKQAIVKYIHVDVTCHVRLATTGGGAVDNEDHLMRVYGLAVVRKNPGQREARIVRLENVGLDSQLNLLFARTHTELEFHPLH